MTRYAAMFERSGQRALGAFLTLGDPGIAECEAYLDALVDGGADMVELGIPFSDPVADGPVIQAAAVRALKAGVRTGDCFEMIGRFRKRHPDIPIGVLTYANIVNARGIEQFAHELAEAGADSLLVADVPCLEAEPYAAAAKAAGIDLVMIAAPNTPQATIERIARISSGYTYCVARTGVTGADRRLQLDHRSLFESLDLAGAAPPVLGFGISSPDHVREALDHGAAGVISGSAIVQRIADGASPAEVAAFVRELRGATEAQRLDFASVAL
ncbi:tryptophan synthase subunit alpha [Sphingomonas alba]|uniref:Tryptophan synthase alpha chain n=1 Tax=Sphingomonas alba TaxID=2908208 RepID=A0ABT0RM11_9SPHN|nr:tryptophan synthase subunit alpha [Sphingomonas alba]MCL6683565.1 tryptophan synthase subunit alpha [Sphingomonas alba]